MTLPSSPTRYLADPGHDAGPLPFDTHHRVPSQPPNRWTARWSGSCGRPAFSPDTTANLINVVGVLGLFGPGRAYGAGLICRDSPNVRTADRRAVQSALNSSCHAVSSQWHMWVHNDSRTASAVPQILRVRPGRNGGRKLGSVGSWRGCGPDRRAAGSRCASSHDAAALRHPVGRGSLCVPTDQRCCLE